MPNYREFLTDFLKFSSTLRDRQLEALALFVVIRKAVQENSFDEYGDPIITYLPEEEIPIIPIHSSREKYLVLNKYLVDDEKNPTLEAIARVIDSIPVRSLIRIPSVSIYDLPSFKTSFTWYEVISTFVFAQEAIFGQRVYMVPHRKSLEF